MKIENRASKRVLRQVDPTKWLQALQANPDPNSCYPEALAARQSIFSGDLPAAAQAVPRVLRAPNGSPCK